MAVVEEVKESAESSSQRRRGARKMAVVEEVKESAEPVAPVEDPASPVLKTSAQPKRGAKKGKGKVVERVAASEIPLPSSEPCGTCKKTKRGITWDNEVEGGDSEEKTSVPVSVADHQVELPPEVKEPSTKKGGRRKLALVEEEEEEMKEVSVTPEEEVVVVEEAPSKKTGRRKAIAVAKTEVPSPKKSGRRAVGEKETEKAVEKEEEQKEVKSPVKRGTGRAAVSEKTEVEEEVNKSPVRRGRKAALAKSPEKTKETSVAAESKQGKKVSPKQAVVDEASSATVSASPARRGRKAKAADLELFSHPWVTALAKEAKKEHEEQEN